MPVTYPLSLPSNGIRRMTWRRRSVVGQARYVFTGKRQVQPWAGQWWEVDVDLPPMKRSAAEAWVAFLTALNGVEGTFLLGDSANRLPRDGGLSTALISASPAIRNGGFETAGAGGADVFANWAESTSGASAFARDTAVFRSGAASCRMDVDGSNSAIFLDQDVLTIGKRYRVSFYARNGGGAAGMRVQDGLVEAFDTGALTTSFQPFSADFTATTQTIRFVRSGLASSQSIWLDDVQVHGLDTYGGLVNGGSQTGNDLVTDGWLANATNILSAGDWIQLGANSGARLHKVLQGANSNASGEATLLIWPALRTSPADNSAVVVQNPVGLFALADNAQEWSIDEARIYGLSFSAVEVIA